MPLAVGILHDALGDKKLSPAEKIATVLDFDSVLGLNLSTEDVLLPESIQKLVDERQEARTNKNWQRSDELRIQLETQGYIVLDSAHGQVIEKKG